MVTALKRTRRKSVGDCSEASSLPPLDLENSVGDCSEASSSPSPDLENSVGDCSEASSSMQDLPALRRAHHHRTWIILLVTALRRARHSRTWRNSVGDYSEASLSLDSENMNAEP